MLEIAICDDEKALRQDLKKIIDRELSLCGENFKIREYDCGETLIQGLKEKPCHILFLDIEMGDLDGMTAARRIRQTDTSCQIIFVTSYPDFVFQGYEVQALNYLLKPYQQDKICEMLHTAINHLKLSGKNYYLLEQKNGSFRLPLHEIKYFLSDKRQIHAVTREQNYSFYEKLDNVETKLPNSFVRIHNRYLVNLKYITSIEGNNVRCEEEILPVSRSCKQNLTIAFAKYMLG